MEELDEIKGRCKSDIECIEIDMDVKHEECSIDHIYVEFFEERGTEDEIRFELLFTLGADYPYKPPKVCLCNQ